MPSQRSMYGPAPVRPRKTNIVRSRTGCKPCRGRRKKCDERQPSCSRCLESGTTCQYEDAFAFRDANTWAALQVKKVRGDRLDIASASTPRTQRSPSEVNWQSDPETDNRVLRESHDSFFSITPSPEPVVLPIIEQLPLAPPIISDFWASDSPASPQSSSALYDRVGIDLLPNIWDFCEQGCNRATVIQRVIGTTRQGSAIAGYGRMSPMSELASLYNPLDDTTWESSNQHEKAIIPTKRLDEAVLVNHPRNFHGSSAPKLSLSCPGITAIDHRYLSHFINHVVQIIPADKSTMLSFISGSPLALRAAMAIGSANLANLHGKYSYSFQTAEEYPWIPDRYHRINSLDYAGRALSMATQQHAAGIGTLIASHLMLSFVELELGTFEGLRQYLASVDSLVYKNHQQLLEDNNGRKMLRNLSNTRTVQRFLAGPMGPQSRESQMDRFWQQLDDQISPESYIVQRLSYSISATLERLCLLTTMRHCLTTPSRLGSIVARHLQLFTNSGYLLHGGKRASESDLLTASVECLAEMKSLSSKLLSVAPPEGLPLSDEETAYCPVEEVKPLYFRSHDDAMRAADYVFCRIMSNESIVYRIMEPRNTGELPVDHSASYWLELLARIALGLDLLDCVNRNIYRRGICGMLLHSAIRCLSPRICGILEDLLDRLILKGCIWEDTTFPSIFSVSTVRAVRDQLQQGRAVLFISTAKQDFNANFTIMANRMTRTLLIHGWEPDGGVFDESLYLNDFETAVGK